MPACPYGKAIRQKNKKTNKCRGATMCAPEKEIADPKKESAKKKKCRGDRKAKGFDNASSNSRAMCGEVTPRGVRRASIINRTKKK